MVERIIGHWTLDEASGTEASDSTSNQNTGVVTGTAIEPGILGNARVFFPSSQDRVEVGNLPLYKFTTAEFTLSAWIRSNTPSATVGIITKRDDTSSNNSYSLTINSSGQLDFSASADGSANTSQVTSADSIADSSWHLVTVTRSGQNYNLYVDGAPVDTTAAGTASIFNSTAPLTIGNFSASTSWDSSFDGYIDDVKVFNYELIPAEVSELFFNTPFDAFPPAFDPVSPIDGETGVLVGANVSFVYSDETPLLDTLNLSFNNQPVLVNGEPTDGYLVTYDIFSDGYSDGYDGYLVTIETLTDLPERTVINVEIDAADAYGTFSLFTYSFNTASSIDPAPTFVNFNPLPDSFGHGTNDAIFFQFNDGYEIGADLTTGADTDTLSVIIEGESVVAGGVIQSGFSGSISANGFDGVDVTLNKDGGWREGRTLHIALSGADGNGTNTTFNYQIKMGGGPVIENVSPGDGYVDIVLDSDVSFEIADAIFGIDQADLQVTIDGANAVVNGAGANGHLVDFEEIEDGYVVTVSGTSLPNFTEVIVSVTVDNRVGDTSILSFSFQTVDLVGPVIVPVVPTSGADRVDPFGQIQIRVTDVGVRPDAYSLDISLNEKPIVTDGIADDGYFVEFDPIEDGYLVRVGPNTGELSEFTDFNVLVEISDFSGNLSVLSYSFKTDDRTPPVITSRVPDDGDDAFEAANVSFSVHDSGGVGVNPDSIDVTIDAAPAITNGVFQSGFTGSIVSSTVAGFDGYDIDINPDNDFTLTETVFVSIAVSDEFDNESTSNYSFVISDLVPPVITNLDPEPGGVTTRLRPYIRFSIHDTGGIGVTGVDLQMTLDGLPAIVDGQFAPNFSGEIEPTIINGFDGYNVSVRLNDSFQPDSEHFVVIDGYDAYGNQSPLSYSFFTTSDSIPPLFENFDPAPGETAVPLNTTIFFEFNDADAYGTSSLANTLNVSIDENIAVVSGEAVNDYQVSVVANSSDGYGITITLPSDLPEFNTVSVLVDGYDSADNFTSFNYSFRMADVSVPSIDPILPLPGATGIGPQDDIIFEVADAYSGVDLDTLNVTVSGTAAITNGVLQDAYGSTVTPTANGSIIELINNDFNELEVINVNISIEDAEGNAKQIEYSFTTKDVTGPDFEAILPAPFSIDVNNHTDISFNYIDPLSGPDLSTLSVTAGGVPFVVNGAAQPGITLSSAAITNGFFIEVDEIIISEEEAIEIVLDGYDNAGNFGQTSYFITGAFVQPTFTPVSPVADEVPVQVDADIVFDFTDAYGVNLNHLEVLFNDAPAVISGIALDGYSVAFAEITDGYQVTVTRDDPFSSAFTVSVDLFGRDNNDVDGSLAYTFKTVSTLPPDITNITPVPSSTDQNEEDNIQFDITDPALNGIVKSSIDVFINFAPAIVDGIPTDGYFAEIDTITDGYRVTLEHDIFEAFSRVFVGISVNNIDGNNTFLEYSYDVSEKSHPILVPIDPVAGEIDVSRNTDIQFQLTDVSGVELDSVVIQVNGVTAFRDASFIFPFDDTNSSVQSVDDLSPFSFIGDPIFTAVPIFDPVLDGYDGYDGYMLDGYDGYTLDGYDGYDGYIPVANIGFEFIIDARADFNFGEVVTISSNATDLRGNNGDRSYTFTTISEAGPPTFDNVSPFPDEEVVLLDANVSFEFNDTGGSGPLLSTLSATIAGRAAITSGVFQDGYTGSTVFDGDGYSVIITPDDGWPNFSTISVSLSGSDSVGNSALFEYSFLTIDASAPIFDAVFPQPNAVGVPTDTAIRFTFNDTTQSGTNINSLGVRILGSLVVIDGNALDGYQIETSPNASDGYDVQLFIDGSFPEFTSIDIVLFGQDNKGNFGEFSYSWTTADETGPVFDSLDPFTPGAKLATDGTVFADILDFGSGVNVDSVGVTIDGTSIIDSGITQATGFVSNLTPITDGYRLSVENTGPLPHVVDSDTAALWLMNDATTAVVNETGNAALDGTAIGTTIVAGKFGSARRYDFIADRILISAEPELELQDMAIEAWVNPASFVADGVIYTYNPRQTSTRAKGIVFRVTAGGGLEVSLGDGGSPFVDVSTATGLIATGSYSHIAAIISKSNNSVKLLVNGVVQASSTFPISSIDYSDDVSGAPTVGTVIIGSSVNSFSGRPVNLFFGDIDDVRITDGPRSVSSVVNSYNRGQATSYAEFVSIDVDLFAQDNSGNDGYISYTFNTLDESAPTFSNFSPAQGAIRADLNSDISFDFTDTLSGPDVDSLSVTIDGQLVVEDGLGLNNTSVVSSDIVDGYNIIVDLDNPLPEFKNIVVVLDGYDIDPNQTVVTYQFSTDDITAPEIRNALPEDGSSDVNPFSDIVFDIHDFNGSGVNLATLDVQVDDIDAVINGVPQDGWTIDTIPTFVDGYDGYNVSIVSSRRFSLDSNIRVLVDGYDAYGNQLITDYAFTTFADVEAPQITNIDPAPLELDVALNKDIGFDITDGYDVDTSRLDVHVDNIPAILDGVFQPGFTGPSNAIAEITDGYRIVIDPDINFVFNQQVTVAVDGYDFSNNQVSLVYFFNTIDDTDGPVVSNRIPDNNDVEVSIDSDVEFDITDTGSGVDIALLDVSIDNIPAIVNGVFQSGWDGLSSGIEAITDGYHVVIDPNGIFEFDYNQIHVVTIDGYDFAFNQVNNVYSFATVADPNEPTLGNFNPLPSQDEAPVATDIVFDITDIVSGVDMTRLDVVVNGVPAITDGEIRAPFADTNSGFTTITDGYTVTLDLFVNFGFNELQTVVIDGYDNADNQVQLEYTFRTKVDVNGPTITPIDPLDSVGDISRTTDIVLRVTDTETGVDLDTIDISIDNVSVLQDGVFAVASGFDGAFSQVVQLPDGYEIILDSTVAFPASHTARVVVDGYDFANNQTHFEYIFTTIDDAGPEVFDFHPVPNSVDAENNPVHISFGIRDVGDGEVDLSTLTVEVAEGADAAFITLFEPIEEFQNGWTGVIDNQPDADGYVINAFRAEQGASFAVYTVRVTAADNNSNFSTTVLGKEGGTIDSGTGTITGGFTLDVGEFFINSNQIENGDLALIKGVGALVVDGYTTSEIVFDRQIAAGGSVEFSIFRGTFMLERRIFRPQTAVATSFTTIDLTYSDPPLLTGTVLDGSAYTISGADFPINISSVVQSSSDTFTLTTDVPIQASPVVQTVTVDSVNILNDFGFSIEDGYESVQFTGPSDVTGPRVLSASNEPFNINATVVFNESMLQDTNLTNPGNYIMSHGAFVSAVVTDPLELDRVILTVENLSGRTQFDIFVNDIVQDVHGNRLDVVFNHAVLNLEVTGAAISGTTGVLKTKNDVNRLHEDSNNWYISTGGGFDVVSKVDLTNTGFVLDGYGFNAIATDADAIYFGRNDGYQADGYGVRLLSFDNLSGNSTLRVSGAFNENTTNPAILSNEVNDLFAITNASDKLLVVGTIRGTTVVKNSETAVNFSTGSNITSAQMDSGGRTLYMANNTLGRIEVYYNIPTTTTDLDIPDAYYSVSSSPEISSAIINQIKIINNTSIMDSGSNTIYVATNNGLTVINTDESVPGVSESGGLSVTYGIEGSGATFEILGGDVNRVEAVDVNTKQLQIFVVTDDDSHKGGLTTINIASNTRFQFASSEIGTLIHNDLRDIVAKNL